MAGGATRGAGHAELGGGICHAGDAEKPVALLVDGSGVRWVASSDISRDVRCRTARTGPKACGLAWRAVELAPNDAQVLWKSAFAIWNLAGGDRDAALELFSRSLLINPNSATALTLAGWIETMRGQDAGRALIARARRLNPRDPRPWLLSGAMAISAVVDGDHLQAVAWARKALAHNRRFAVALRVLAVALVESGQRDEAAEAVQDLRRIEPGLTVSAFFHRKPVPLERMARTYAEALRAAGLPG